jgi:5-methyltetrahydropteroyltriglutamate--homocysteine methyltransferase
VQRSGNRILTTHAGSLPRPAALTALYAARARGEEVDASKLATLAEAATGDVIGRQIELGLDVINNGEVGRESFFTYLRDRMSGFGGHSERKAMADLLRYPDYRAQLQRFRSGRERIDLLTAPRALDAVRYVSSAPIEAECDQLGRLLSSHKGHFVEAFMSSPSPGIVAAAMQNTFYDDLETYVRALGQALATEYRTIVSKGFLLQIDAPDLALERHTLFQDKSLSDFLDFARLVVDTINATLENVPAERVRLHVCWGNYEGPHDLDVPLQDIWPVIENVKAGALLLSMANPRHCHEYRLFETGCLPADALLIAGVIDTTTNYVEHPEAVAERLAQVAEAVGDPSRVLAGTDCGFETAAGTTMVAADIAWAKLRSLVEGAQIASGRLFA